MLGLCFIIKRVSRGSGRDHHQQGSWGDGIEGYGKGLDDSEQGMKGQAGLRKFLWEVLGVLGDVELRPEREECSHHQGKPSLIICYNLHLLSDFTENYHYFRLFYPQIIYFWLLIVICNSSQY
jgi:hypothetical protein